MYIVGGSSGIAGLLLPLGKSLVGSISGIAGLLQQLLEVFSLWLQWSIAGLLPPLLVGSNRWQQRRGWHAAGSVGRV